ncbi:sirohydrochlorin cobaltochelatase [Arthrobacter ulcerisalmonis]|uniref:Sirohydrochlorin cobaltochelatase n=1 Tax=Arthrobacter ulcerisalmonis TaxID=2483813 RepID=A0A3P5XBP2_9MICC|nr:CbiX/SirB N-terminal domain-containing protein [Arthrobacter ulcerisalmonis]VDC24914.1 sirohydrochlorin cobaltochelatase [Arthrobacter ulcerisalmonis]
MNTPILIACAHGTSSDVGAAEVNGLRAAMLALRPELDIREAYVDVQQPDLVDVVAGLPDGDPAVVVPLLLSVGYHTKVDIARAVGSRPHSLASAPLGPDPRLAQVLDARLREAGITEHDAVVLAAAGSSNPAAAVSVQEIARQLRKLLPNKVVVAYGAAEKPTVPEAVAALRTAHPGSAGGEGSGRVIIASYLLAHGYFHDQLAKAGADVVAEPLLPSELVAQVALDRYTTAIAGHPVDAAEPAGSPSPAGHAAAANTTQPVSEPVTGNPEAPTSPSPAAAATGLKARLKRLVTKYFPR